MGVFDVVYVLFMTANLRFSRPVYYVCISARSERFLELGSVELFPNINSMFSTSYTSLN